MTFRRCCKVPMICWWAFRDRTTSVYRCVSCGECQDGPRYPENPAMRVRVER